MRTTTRRPIAGLVVVGLMGVGSPEVPAAATQTLPRVRSSDVSLAALITRMTEHSATFRALIGTINASDGIVYVEAGECGHDVATCLMGVSSAGAYRMLWIKVDKDRRECDLIASIGHELQHAVEILSDSDVQCGAGMFLYYMRMRRRGSGPLVFETTAATDAGIAVRSEIRTCRSR